jgi:hypothetical protein
MAEKVLTAPLALIKVNGITVGKMRNIRCTETFRRGRVSGIGELTPQEVPALEWNGTLTCQFYEVKFKETGIPEGIKRTAPSLLEFVDNILLQENGVDVVIYKKVENGINTATGLIESTIEPHATITGCFIDREGMDVNEGQISGHDQDFTYINPILYNL